MNTLHDTFLNTRFIQITIMEALKEGALLEFDAEFKKAGFMSGTPKGMEHVLSSFKAKASESEDQGRRRLFKRIFGILWFGNKVGRGQIGAASLPTYVYPDQLKRVVWVIVGGNPKDHANPEGSSVYHVTLGDLHEAKWPVTKAKK